MIEFWVWVVLKQEDTMYAESEIDEVFYTEEAAINYVAKVQENLSYDIDTMYNYSITNHKVKVG